MISQHHTKRVQLQDKSGNWHSVRSGDVITIAGPVRPCLANSPYLANEFLLVVNEPYIKVMIREMIDLGWGDQSESFEEEVVHIELLSRGLMKCHATLFVDIARFFCGSK